MEGSILDSNVLITAEDLAARQALGQTIIVVQQPNPQVSLLSNTSGTSDVEGTAEFARAQAFNEKLFSCRQEDGTPAAAAEGD